MPHSFDWFILACWHDIQCMRTGQESSFYRTSISPWLFEVRKYQLVKYSYCLRRSGNCWHQSPWITEKTFVRRILVQCKPAFSNLTALKDFVVQTQSQQRSQPSTHTSIGYSVFRIQVFLGFFNLSYLSWMRSTCTSIAVCVNRSISQSVALYCFVYIVRRRRPHSAYTTDCWISTQ